MLYEELENTYPQKKLGYYATPLVVVSLTMQQSFECFAIKHKMKKEIHHGELKAIYNCETYKELLLMKNNVWRF